MEQSTKERILNLLVSKQTFETAGRDNTFNNSFKMNDCCFSMGGGLREKFLWGKKGKERGAGGCNMASALASVSEQCVGL